jgi:hypothetical protein
MNQQAMEDYWDRYQAAMDKLLLAKDFVLSAERGAIYFEDLHAFAIEEVEHALDRARKDLKWFPQVSELISFIRDRRVELKRIRDQEYRERIQKQALLIGPGDKIASKETASKFLTMIYGRLSEKEKDERQAKDEIAVKNRRYLKNQAASIPGIMKGAAASTGTEDPKPQIEWGDPGSDDQ